MYEKIMENKQLPEEEARQTADIIALAAVKYGDLSNQASKDYIFDIDRFTSFEGDTGPYILYTMVRIKSILAKYVEAGGSLDDLKIGTPRSGYEKTLLMKMAGFNQMIEEAFKERAPHKVCSFIYDTANAFNSFYHETKILSEADEEVKKQYIALLKACLDMLTACTDLLGFKAPERM